MQIGFDIISDLTLTKEDTFTWDGKPTSLYCAIAGNISTDKSVVQSVLSHLSKLYHGVFFIDGSLEHESLEDHQKKVNDLTRMCKLFKNVVYLHNNVVIVDGVALVGSNGWYGNYVPKDAIDNIRLEILYQEDLSYVSSTIEKLQLHVDVKKIVMVTNSVPEKDLYYGELPLELDEVGPTDVLSFDTEGKVSHWVFGSYEKDVDTMKSGVHYINNSSHRKNPYWAKRIVIDI